MMTAQGKTVFFSNHRYFPSLNYTLGDTVTFWSIAVTKNQRGQVSVCWLGWGPRSLGWEGSQSLLWFLQGLASASGLRQVLLDTFSRSLALV